jgi:ATP-dependent Clp protease ATP-binding subunit ClpC
MNGYNFTQRVRESLAKAREEAARLHHAYVGTEHVLLGLIAARPNLATEILIAHGLTPDQVREQVEGVVKLGNPSGPTGPDLPYTSRAKKSLELAMSEARDLNHSWVDCGHLLLGLVREEHGLAAQVLNDFGLTIDSGRRHFLELLAAGKEDEESYSSPRAERHMSPGHAAAMLRLMAASPEIAVVFAQHEIDLPTLIEDVAKAR